MISIILCTYNREKSLEKALRSLSASVMPPETLWEVLVVDNRSKDRTADVVQVFIHEFPGRFRYLFESTPGKSFALNAGIAAAAEADVLAFVDDDVEVASDWLQRITDPLRSGRYCGAGGRILPDRQFTPPRWMDTSGRYSLAPLAIFDLGMLAGPLLEPPFGTNMAFKREVFNQYGGFRTDLGPRPGNEIRNEDAEFGDRLLSAGEQLWYEPTAVVYHSIPAERVTRKYFLAWWFDKARGDIRQSGVAEHAALRILGIPLFYFRRFVAWSARWCVTFEPRQRFNCQIKIWSIAGAMTECFTAYRSR